jgi:hypothetical protein
VHESVYGPSRHLGKMWNLVVIGGIADMLRLLLGSTGSRMTQSGHWFPMGLIWIKDRGEGPTRSSLSAKPHIVSKRPKEMATDRPIAAKVGYTPGARAILPKEEH